MKNDIIIFDTNFYRDFYHNNLQGKSIEVQNRIINILNNCEKKKKYRKKLNFFVVQELIKHLTPPAKNMKIFYETLLFVYKHNYKAPKITKPHNMVIYEMIHSRKYVEYVKKYRELVDLINLLCTSELEMINPVYLKQEIEIIAERIKNIKDEFVESLKSIFNNIFEKCNDKEKAKVKTEFNNYDYKAYEELVKNITAVEIDRSIILDEKQLLPTFQIYENNFFGLSLVIHYFNRVFNGNGNFNFNSKDNKNDIIDFLICHNIGLKDNTKLVTKENSIKNMFTEVGYSNKFIDTNIYLESIGFKL